MVREVEASGLLVIIGGGGVASSSEEQRSITSLLALACFVNRALRLGPLLGDIGLGVGSPPLVPFLPVDEVGAREDDIDALVEEGGVFRVIRLILSREGSGELGGGGVRVELLLDGGRYSSGSSSSSGEMALWIWVGR